MSKAKLFLRIGILVCSFSLFATTSNETFSQDRGHSINASLTHDFVRNISGGKKTGQAYMGLINLDFTLDSQRLNFWKNGEFRIQIQNTYGQKPTKNLIGDLQVLSNIENGTYTYLYQLWYKHTIGDFSILAGKHDMNEVFFTSEFACEYVNSSFGIMPVASLNIPVSIFPNTTLGIVARYDLSSDYDFYAGIYNGRPGELTRSNFGTDLNLKPRNGRFYVSEIHGYYKIAGRPGTYKIGGFYHSGNFDENGENMNPQNGIGGIYLIADQMIFQNSSKENSGLGALMQLGYAPGIATLNDFYLAYGLNYSGLMSKGDKLGLAVAHASVNKSAISTDKEDFAPCETAFELTYRVQLVKHLDIQPDLQYVLNPGMTLANDNAFAGLIRIHWSLN